MRRQQMHADNNAEQGLMLGMWAIPDCLVAALLHA